MPHKTLARVQPITRSRTQHTEANWPDHNYPAGCAELQRTGTAEPAFSSVPVLLAKDSSSRVQVLLDEDDAVAAGEAAAALVRLHAQARRLGTSILDTTTAAGLRRNAEQCRRSDRLLNKRLQGSRSPEPEQEEGHDWEEVYEIGEGAPDASQPEAAAGSSNSSRAADSPPWHVRKSAAERGGSGSGSSAAC